MEQSRFFKHSSLFKSLFVSSRSGWKSALSTWGCNRRTNSLQSSMRSTLTTRRKWDTLTGTCPVSTFRLFCPHIRWIQGDHVEEIPKVQTSISLRNISYCRYLMQNAYVSMRAWSWKKADALVDVVLGPSPHIHTNTVHVCSNNCAHVEFLERLLVRVFRKWELSLSFLGGRESNLCIFDASSSCCDNIHMHCRLGLAKCCLLSNRFRTDVNCIWV